MLRKAKTSDVKLMHRMINLSAAKGEMLPRSLVDLYNSLRDFYVYLEEDNGPIVGIVGLEQVQLECVAPSRHNRESKRQPFVRSLAVSTPTAISLATDHAILVRQHEFEVG